MGHLVGLMVTNAMIAGLGRVVVAVVVVAGKLGGGLDSDVVDVAQAVGPVVIGCWRWLDVEGVGSLCAQVVQCSRSSSCDGPAVVASSLQVHVHIASVDLAAQ